LPAIGSGANLPTMNLRWNPTRPAGVAVLVSLLLLPPVPAPGPVVPVGDPAPVLGSIPAPVLGSIPAPVLASATAPVAVVRSPAVEVPPVPAAAPRALAPAADRAWPIGGPPLVTRRFDPPAQRWLPGQRGVDLAGSPGTVVSAAAAGVVYFAGPVAGRGVVSVQHHGGLRTTYQPVEPVVSAGDPVAAGDPLGVLAPGHAGCPVAACLHWGLRRGETYLDPLALLGLGRVRLLPIHQAGSGVA
jgi:murein DD-endopeptidase MepM/ murein hydrolase activator NlpD